MNDNNKYRSEVYEAIHEMVKALYSVGAISKETMEEYDVMCLSPEGENNIQEV